MKILVILTVIINVKNKYRTIRIVKKLIGKLNILFKSKLVCSIKGLMKIIFCVSSLIILLLIKFLISLFKNLLYKIINDEIKKKIFFLFKLKLNFSFDANEVMYINKISMPPIKIKNKEYENQKVFIINPVIIQVKIVWFINPKPIDIGWFMLKNIIEFKIKQKNNKYSKISENSFIKILILGINDKSFFFFLKLKIRLLYFWLTRPMFLLNYSNYKMITVLFIYIFFIGVLSFVYSWKHLLRILLSLEFIVLRLFFILIFYLNFNSYELYFSIYFLSFSVCEGVLGLSILVSIIRTHGNDYFLNFSLLQC